MARRQSMESAKYGKRRQALHVRVTKDIGQRARQEEAIF